VSLLIPNFIFLEVEIEKSQPHFRSLAKLNNYSFFWKCFLSIFVRTEFTINNYIMGKGDKKSKKGKISSGSYGVTRQKKKKNAYVAAKPKAKKATPKAKEAPAAEKPAAKKPAAKKAPAKKAAAKK
jgi:30S ribosomal protein S31